MDLDRKTTLQILASAGAVLIFIGALAGLSVAFGSSEPVENKQVEGTLEGEFENLTVDGDQVSGTLTGDVENGIKASIDGTVHDGTLEDDRLTAEFEGSISGSVDGTVTGELNGTVDREAETVDGEFTGLANGTTETALSSDGGLALVGLIAAFIILLPIVGYLIERETENDE